MCCLSRWVALAVTLASCGCTSYEYVIMHPPEFAGRLTKQERVLTDEAIVFHLVDQNSRVGIRVENASSDAIAVKGEESYVVTPDGRSESMRSATIAPNTWSAFTVPPLIRVYEPSGGVGIGFGVGSWGHHGYGGVGVGYDDPLYLPRDEVAWRWSEGEVRIHLVMEQASDPPTRIERDFTIERRKIN